MADQGKILARQMELLKRSLGVTEPASVEEAWECAAYRHARTVREIACLGYYLRHLKERLPHGEYLVGLESCGIPTQRASESVRVAELLLAHGAQHKLLDLSPTKLIALASVEPEVLADAVDQGEIEIDDIDTWPVRMVRDEVRKLRQRHERDADTIAAKNHELMLLHNASQARVAGSDYAPSVVRLRGESAALTEQAVATVQSLVTLTRELPRAMDLGEDRGEREKNLSAGAKALYQQAIALFAHATDLVETIRAELGGFLPEHWTVDDLPLPLPEDEVRLLAQGHEVFVRRQQLDAQVREDARIRDGKIKRGPGRPRKYVLEAPPKRKRGRPRKRREGRG